MEFEKYGFSENNGARVIHCSFCDCEDTEKSSLNKNTAKATGG